MSSLSHSWYHFVKPWLALSLFSPADYLVASSVPGSGFGSFDCDTFSYDPPAYNTPTIMGNANAQLGALVTFSAKNFESECAGAPYATQTVLRTYPPLSELNGQGINIIKQSTAVNAENDYDISWSVPDPTDTGSSSYLDNFAIIISLEDASGGVYDSMRSIFMLQDSIPIACTHSSQGWCTSDNDLYTQLFANWNSDTDDTQFLTNQPDIIYDISEGLPLSTTMQTISGSAGAGVYMNTDQDMTYAIGSGGASSITYSINI